MEDQDDPSTPETSASEADTQATPPSAPEMFQATVEPATAEDYARGFSVGTTFGTPYKDHPTLSERMGPLPDRLQDQPQGKGTVENDKPNS
jgi:hypothetical protein